MGGDAAWYQKKMAIYWIVAKPSTVSKAAALSSRPARRLSFSPSFPFRFSHTYFLVLTSLPLCCLSFPKRSYHQRLPDLLPSSELAIPSKKMQLFSIQFCFVAISLWLLQFLSLSFLNSIGLSISFTPLPSSESIYESLCCDTQDWPQNDPQIPPNPPFLPHNPKLQGERLLLAQGCENCLGIKRPT